MVVSVGKTYSDKQYTLKNNDKSQLSFKNGGPLTSVMTLVDSNDFVNYTAVDLMSMVIPRTVIDSTRNKYAGAETFIREVYGTVVNCIIPGFIAYGVAKLYGMATKKQYNVEAGLFSTNKSLDVFAHHYKVSNGKTDSKAYIKSCFDGFHSVLRGTGYQEITADQHKELDGLIDRFAKYLDSDQAKEINWKNQILGNKDKELEEVENSIGKILGARDSIVFNYGKESINASVGKILTSAVELKRKVFDKIEPDEKMNDVITHLKSVNKTKMVIALSIASGLMLVGQYFNRYLTKKKTGQDSFVGYKDYASSLKTTQKHGKDIAFKGGIGGAIGKGLEGLFGNLEYEGIWPVLSQMKLVYVFTVSGRLLASRDKNELRESATRDIFGYFNWLVLGGFVGKLAAMAFDKYNNKGSFLVNTTPKPEGEGFMNSIKKTSVGTFLFRRKVKSHSEIKDYVKYLEELKAKVLKGLIPEHMKEQLKEDLKNLEKVDNFADMEKRLLHQKNFAVFAGLLYSCLALGIGIPLLNKYTTDKKRARELAELEKLKAEKLNTPVQEKESIPADLSNMFAASK